MSKWAVMIDDGDQPLAGLAILKFADNVAKELEEHADGVRVYILDEHGEIYAERDAKWTSP